MRGISKAMLRTTVGLAFGAALVVGGAGVASAAPVSPAAHTTSSSRPSCNRFAREQWNLKGRNQVEAGYQGSTYTYSVTFRQSGSCLTGTLNRSVFPDHGADIRDGLPELCHVQLPVSVRFRPGNKDLYRNH